jgi:hypothetical protein
MIKSNKNTLELTRQSEQEYNPIIAGKTYNIKELNAVFNINSLMLVNSKEELIKYEQMAIETGVKQFKQVVNTVYNRKYAV